MKTVLLLALLAVPALLSAAPAPNYHARAATLVTEFMRAAEKPDDDAAWQSFAEKKGIVGASFSAACTEALAVARALAADGVPATSEHFLPLLRDTVNPGNAAAEPAKTAAAAPAPKPDEDPVDAGDKRAYEQLARKIADEDDAIAELEANPADADASAAKKQEYAERLARARGRREAWVAQQSVLEKKHALGGAREKLAAVERAGDQKKIKSAKTAVERASAEHDGATLAAEALAERWTTPDSISRSGAVKFFHAGLRQRNPYSLAVTTDADGKKIGKLSHGSDDVSGFLEFVYSNRWAWNDARTAAARHAEEQGDGREFGFGVPSWSDRNLANLLDFECRIGFGLGKDDKIDAAAVAGSGDVNIDLNLGRQIWRSPFFGDDGYASFNVEVGYGLSTRTDTFRGLERLSYGLSYTASFPNWGATPGNVLLQLKTARTSVDALSFSDATSTTVDLYRDGLPRYSKKDGWVVETDVIYPLSRDAHLTFGARIYSGIDPNPWSIYVGYSKSISELARAFLPGGNSSEPGGKPSL